MNKYFNEMCDYTVARCIFTNDQKKAEKQWICNAELFSFFVPFIFRVKVNTEQICLVFHVFYAATSDGRDEWRAKQRSAAQAQAKQRANAMKKQHECDWQATTNKVPKTVVYDIF